MQVAPSGGKAQDRVSDQLPGPVVGHVPSPARLEQLDAPLTQLGVGGQDVIAVSARSQRDHVRVLEEQELVGNLLGGAPAHQLGLQGQTLAVFDASQAGDLQRPVFRARRGLVGGTAARRGHGGGLQARRGHGGREPARRCQGTR